MSTPVNPKFAGLPLSASRSEVMESKRANEANRATLGEQTEQVIQIMEEWDNHLKREGFSVPNSCLEVFAEVTIACTGGENKELAGKFALAVVSALNGVARQYASSGSLLDKLENITESLFSGVDELKKATDSLTKIVPREKIKIKKKTAHGPEAQGVSTVVPDEEKGSMEVDPQIKDGEPERSMGPAAPPEKSNGPSHKEIAKVQCRDHYNDPMYVSLPQPNKDALMNYYLEHVIGLSPSLHPPGSAVHEMLCDLSDKARVLKMCQDIKHGLVTSDDISDAVEEMQDAITACGQLYGNYTPSSTIIDGRAQLVLN